MSVIPQRIYGTQKRRARVRALIMVDEHVLLVRNWLGMQEWTLPGGGAKRSETDQEALVRELQEELGISIKQSSLIFLNRFMYNDIPTLFKVSCFYSTGPSNLKAQKLVPNHELIDAAWFPVNAVPKDFSEEFKEAYSLFQKQRGAER
ncbi:MAG TPA: NUDIX domain-containing protein [Candidatus Dormibacteraeota bacterium]|nr:NUDIX domain-containing protein [Candidatus Dormibacteraeota bacterium]